MKETRPIEKRPATKIRAARPTYSIQGAVVAILSVMFLEKVRKNKISRVFKRGKMFFLKSLYIFYILMQQCFHKNITDIELYVIGRFVNQ